MKTIIVFLVLLSITSCTTYYKNPTPPTTVASVDLQRYAGTWYEIARFPTFFQRNCKSSRAEYEPVSEGKISVKNFCNHSDASTTSIEGEARVVDAANAKLKVRFNSFPARYFEGDYWIIDLAPDYSWAVVSNPAGDYLWILSRSSNMDPGVYERIVSNLQARGFETAYLIKDMPVPEK